MIATLRKKILSPNGIVLLMFLVVFSIGIFLRSYAFHEWLFFGSDQVNDAVRVGSTVRGETSWPLLGPDMSHSGSGGREGRFHLGPMYYYFEIISGKLFGDDPVAYAYPDWLFSILSFPLLFSFFRRFFSIRESLPLLLLYAVSWYMLKFSHSAWNPNSIPFFVILFLLAFHSFLCSREKTPWYWVVSLGIALGVGVQLHAILLVLLPVTLLLGSLLFLRKCPFAGKQWLVICAVALLLNVPQLRSEVQTNFANTKIFFQSAKGTDSDSHRLIQFRDAINCHIQVNAFMLSSVGQDDCDFTVIKAVTKGTSRSLAAMRDIRFLLGQIVAVILSLGGYGLLIYFFRKEVDERRKKFLGLILLFVGLSFFVLLPVDASVSRYFVHVFFVPLLFLGLFSRYFLRTYPGWQTRLGLILVFYFLLIANLLSLRTGVDQYVTMEYAGDNTIILGTVESMVDFMLANVEGQKQVFLITDKRRMNYIKSLMFVAEKQGYRIVRAQTPIGIASGSVIFSLSGNDIEMDDQVDGYVVSAHRDFGDVGLYKIAP